MSFKNYELNDKGFNEMNHFKQVMADVAVHVEDNIPNSREKSLALTKLEEFSFWATTAICSAPENHKAVKDHVADARAGD